MIPCVSLRLGLVLILLTVGLPVSRAAQAPAVARARRPLAVNEQQVFTPGYPIGDIAIGDPKIADFKVMPGRREVLLLGKGAGETTLVVWDQQSNRRHEVTLTVLTRHQTQLERDLRELLNEFPSVEVRTLGGALVVAGVVSSKDDLAAIERIAAAAKARSLVRYVPPVAPPAEPATEATLQPLTVPAVAPTTRPPAAPLAAADAARPAVPLAAASAGTVRYEIELLEASTQFRSGSYARGIEPSGRRLFQASLDAPIGGDGTIFIGGTATGGAQDSRRAAGGEPVESGIRLTLRPAPADARGRFTTFILVETNLPLDSDLYDPETWRRARWEFTTTSGDPFGIRGGDLLATPDVPQGKSKARSTHRTASTVSRMPGVSGRPGVQHVPVFGSLFGSESYKQKKTQLLVVLRPQIVPPQP